MIENIEKNKDYNLEEYFNNKIIRKLDNIKEDIKLYPLQMANIIRINKNDVVYIFDEVGTGKTVSAGLSILGLVTEENRQKNILIITPNPVIDHFAEILNNKFKFYEDREKYNIEIINNDCRNIKKHIREKYDLIIIDEAHCFLNEESKRTIHLKSLSAKKIMFLTATPIKEGKKDLEKYAEIGANILLDNENKGEILNKLKEYLEKYVSTPRLLSESFDTSCPITRYFKDVSRNLEISYDENSYFVNNPKVSPIRLIPRELECNLSKLEEIKYVEKDKEINKLRYKASLVVNEINKINSTGKNNRFIIFTRYVKDIEEIASILQKNNFEEFNFSGIEKNENKNTYCKIYGGKDKNTEILKRLNTNNKEESLPTVVITTYDTSEVGIEFPAYNYIINFHISSYPSRIEQRFGRIDRIVSKYEKINMWFVIEIIEEKAYSNNIEIYYNNNDTNTSNYLNAMTIYLNKLINILPSKNILLTEGTPEVLKRESKGILLKWKEYNKFYENEKQLLENFTNSPEDFYEQLEKQLENKIINYCNNELYNKIGYPTFLKDFGLNIPASNHKTRKKNQKAIRHFRKKYDHKIKEINDFNKKIDKLEEMIKNKSEENTKDMISNKILYSKINDEGELKEIEAIDSEEIVEKIKRIKEYNDFIEYIKNLFNKYKNV